MSDSTDKIKKENAKLRNLAIITISTGMFLMFIFPLIFTGQFGNSPIDFTGTGQIGDTIGGLTAPVVGLVSAILIYLGFNAQLKANEIQWEALNMAQSLQKDTELFTSLLGEINYIGSKINDEEKEILRFVETLADEVLGFKLEMDLGINDISAKLLTNLQLYYSIGKTIIKIETNDFGSYLNTKLKIIHRSLLKPQVERVLSNSSFIENKLGDSSYFNNHRTWIELVDALNLTLAAKFRPDTEDI